MTAGGPGAAVGLHPPTPDAEARERVLAGLPVSHGNSMPPASHRVP